ncbi:MAG: UDP-N-acetylmuramoyl-tripeptide--D-alanyl-D-alanine ligase [Bacteroidota bacterium]
MEALQRIYEAYQKGASICTDTRKITPGCIFFSLRGDNFNGNLFAQQALDAGASLSVVDDDALPQNDRFVKVQNVLESLQELALLHRKNLNIPVIGITGSNGKTTTKELVSRVLSKKYRTYHTQGNLNNHIGVPLTLLSIPKDTELAVVEMGANHRHEIGFLCSIALPTHVLITNVGKAHLEGFGGFEGVKLGKGEMYTFAKSNGALVFLNADNPHLVSMLGQHDRVFAYGSSADATIQGVAIPNTQYASVKWVSNKTNDWNQIQSNITGHYNCENILSAVSIGTHFGVEDSDIISAVESYTPDNQRSQELSFGETKVILDAYNANPTSMEAAILNFQNSFTGKKMIFLGDMLELGDESPSEHSRILELACKTGCDKIILVGPRFKTAAQRSGPSFVFCLDDSAQAAEWIQSNRPGKCTILIKGSRGSKMEKVLEGLK